jgi:hypothetical protein
VLRCSPMSIGVEEAGESEGLLFLVLGDCAVRGGVVEWWSGGEVERWRGGEVERWRGGEVRLRSLRRHPLSRQPQ